MITKTFEIRDRATFIPVMATKLSRDNDRDHYLLRRAGFEHDGYVIVTKLDPVDSNYDPHQWSNFRTMGNAHTFILDNFDNLPTGAVIDVEFILGEKSEPKKSEQETAKW